MTLTRCADVVRVVMRTERTGGGGAARLLVIIGHGSRMSELDTQLIVPTSRWTHVAISHAFHKVKSSVLTAWVDDNKSALPLKYPAPQAHVRAYAACAGYTRAKTQHMGASRAQQVCSFKGTPPRRPSPTLLCLLVLCVQHLWAVCS